MKTDEDENHTTLTIRDDVPFVRPTNLVRRMALRDPDITLSEVLKLVDASGLRISPASVAFTLSEFRACYAVIEEAGLLRRDADARRRAIESDFEPMARKRIRLHGHR